ncbi:apolipoprotein D-like [Daktulosphaira vitifoliae]|uniref:apolipoprotein D-like n=1 Tax=Daktulosphaira vitifoliae TaxID=58002 RepID=UPI0021A985F1|nr:apolipoprotein D-like [Daktulosphaira vitifoliae]
MLGFKDLWKITILLVCYFVYISCHTYHLGQCPSMEPMADFSMQKFLGPWYAVQKSSTSSRCMVYNFTNTQEPNIYKLEQISENSIINVAKSNNYHYIGNLKVDPSLPSRMSVSFPLSVAGKASFVVFATDYDTYAGVYSCQKIPFGHRHSVTILSRDKVLNKQYLDKLRNKIASANVNPYDLSIVDQSNCNHLNSSMRVEINDQTFSAKNIGHAVSKVGEKIGQGVEYVIDGGKKVYNSIKSKPAEEINPDAEWYP